MLAKDGAVREEEMRKVMKEEAKMSCGEKSASTLTVTRQFEKVRPIHEAGAGKAAGHLLPSFIIVIMSIV